MEAYDKCLNACSVARNEVKPSGFLSADSWSGFCIERCGLATPSEPIPSVGFSGDWVSPEERSNKWARKWEKILAE